MAFSGEDWFLYLVVVAMLAFMVLLAFVTLTDRDTDRPAAEQAGQ